MKKITLIISLLLLGLHSNAQDTCASAFPLTTGGIYSVGIINGTDVPTPICANNGSIPVANIPAGEWYAYTPTQDLTVTVTSDIAANTPRKDTRVHVYTGTCGALTCYAGDDDSGSSYSSVCIFNVTAGTTYYIAWDNRWLSTAKNTGFSFQLIEAPIVVPPPTPITYTTQTLSTINSTYNICVVDMNNDNLDDIVGVSSNNLRIHFQGSTPNAFTVTDFPITGANYMPGWSMAAGDYNKDGFNDLALGNTNGLSIIRSNNTGTAYTGITPGEYIFCQRTNFADLNKDGNLDIFSCHDVAPNVYYLNDGNANLTYYQSNTTAGAMNLSSGGGNYATLFTDFDNDGDTDVFISKCSGPPCQLFRYDGGNTYTNVSSLAGIDVTPIQTWSSAIADFDNDGDMDIIITASTGTHKYFRNNFETTNTLGSFTNITSGSGWDTNTSTNIDNIAYDFDNDGFIDVLGGGNKIMFNQGNGTFAPVSYSGIAVGAVGDLNNDGFLDIQSGSTIRYAVPNTNKWLKVALQGVQSNSNGIGARIEIYGTWGKQIRDIRSGEGFKYMSSLNAHFGIGQATIIDQVVIKWPSGIVDTYTNVTPNQMLKVVEGATLAVNSFNNTAFSLYPNPVKHNLNISLNVNNPVEFKTAQVFDMNGKVVLESKFEGNTLNVDKLATGTYILLLKDAQEKNYSQKFIKE
ncbi:T9SS type A sorting domain-containing protein [Flavobacterium silvisoli]|uniref:T9SS type A sorting domain-containing protein n=1 Tax=Flavobacterium silvisoli TaxID=2529433 RepID=A0A4Q9YWQ1_9FLAO|nr:CRTAC1 family protein [Flavobacterium silvisoli]TBX65789.1 T9SS type A sorting domain-containing protein [Flavobacterium silvisoli]